MKYSTKLSDAIHMLAFIYINPKNDLSSATIAFSIHTNASYVRQLMMALRKAGILSSSQGQAKPGLTRELKDITLFDMYQAIEGTKPLLHLDTNINPDCNVGVNIHYALREYYQKVQDAAEEEMKRITMEDVVKSFYQLSRNQAMEWD